MWKARYIPYTLDFIRPAGTSRGTLASKAAWFIELEDASGRKGLGEVGFIPGLSLENPDEMDIRLDHICKLIGRGEMDPAQPLPSLPGVRFALDTALCDLEGGGKAQLFDSAFSRGQAGIPINGLIWMGDRAFMLEQVREKMKQGFRVLKLKVGALDFREELRILGSIRERADASELEIRLDANGAWKAWEAREKLEQLAVFDIHSLEQPLAAGQPEAMSALCREAIIPIALDEELIGIRGVREMEETLSVIKPRYIILKPGLIGGLGAADRWVELAGKMGIGWWATSALESNVGLNAIAQWAASKNPDMLQGLGTGHLYHNNIPSPLRLEGEKLWYGGDQGAGDHGWDYKALESER